MPQKRERLITVGIRNDLVGKVSFSFPKEHDYKPVLRDVLLDCPEGPGVPYGEIKGKYLNWFHLEDIGEILIRRLQKHI